MVIAAVLVFFSSLSGLIDIFGLINDSHISVTDIKANPEARWFYENTPKNTVVLNSGFFNHPAAIAGRKIFLGWPYFTMSAGYPHVERSKIVRKIYSGVSPAEFCPLLRSNNISYLTVEDNANLADDLLINSRFFLDNFKPAYLSENGKYAIYTTEQLCTQVPPLTIMQN